MSVRDWNQNYRQQRQDGNIQSITSAYNFVPLSETVVLPDWAEQASHDRPFIDGVSGSLTLTVKNHSPLLVGAKDGTSVTPFMFPDGTAGIPGSSLRGMIRNVLEIAGYGKMRLVDDKRYGVRDLQADFYKQQLTKDGGQNRYIPQSRAGWLKFEHDRWTITPCDMARVERSSLQNYYGNSEWINIANRPGSKEKYQAWLRAGKPLAVNFDKEAAGFHPHRGGRIHLQYSKVKAVGSGKEQGYLVFTGQPGPQKHMEFIFFNEQPEQCFTLPENIMRDFQHIYQDSVHWKYLKEMKLFPQQGIPVFYLVDGNGKISSLGLSQMYRLAYRQSVGELIDRASDRHRQNNKPDLAELIFGAVDESDGTGSLKGRGSFSHAVCQTPSPYQQEKCEAILSSPKSTYYPNYIVQNEEEGRLTGRHYRTYMDPEARIRGWKRYPVKTAITVPPLDNEQRASGAWNKLFPITDELSFIAKLRFHNLRPVELGAIAWCLNWGGRTGLRHSIGMGKPFGFGQISIGIDKDDIRPNKHGADISLAACIEQFTDYMDRELGQNWLESENMQQLMAMAMPNNPERQINNLIPLDLGQVNKFVTAKTSSLVLKKYIQVKPPVLGGEVIWLEETLAELSKQTNTPVEKVLFTKGLAQRWQALEDRELKIKIRVLIKKRWQDKWDEERITGSVKIAKAIYLEEL